MCMDFVGKNYNNSALISIVKTEWRKHKGPSLRRWDCVLSQFVFLIAAESSCFDIWLDTHNTSHCMTNEGVGLAKNKTPLHFRTCVKVGEQAGEGIWFQKPSSSRADGTQPLFVIPFATDQEFIMRRLLVEQMPILRKIALTSSLRYCIARKLCLVLTCFTWDTYLIY